MLFRYILKNIRESNGQQRRTGRKEWKRKRKEGRRKGRTNLHGERNGGAMWKREAGEGRVDSFRLQGLTEWRSRGRLHLWHPIHLT